MTCSHAATHLRTLHGCDGDKLQATAASVGGSVTFLSHPPETSPQASSDRQHVHEECGVKDTAEFGCQPRSHRTSSSAKPSTDIKQDSDMLQQEAPSTAAIKQAAAAAAAQQRGCVLSKEQDGSSLTDAQQVKQLLLAAASPVSAAAAATCTAEQEQVALLQLAKLLLRLQSKAAAHGQQQATPADVLGAGCKRPAEAVTITYPPAPAEPPSKATKFHQQLGPHGSDYEQQHTAAPALQAPSAAVAATLQRVTQEQQYALLLNAAAAVCAAGAAAAFGVHEASSSYAMAAYDRPVLPVRQLPLDMRVSYMQSAGLLVPADAVAAVRQHQQQAQQLVLQQSQQQQLHHLQQPDLLLYEEEPAAAGAGTGKASRGSRSSRSQAKAGARDAAAWYPGKTPARPPAARVFKRKPPRVSAALTGDNGRVAGWPDRSYMPGSDRDRVWQEHKLVLRVVKAALQGQAHVAAAVQEASSIFCGRSCTGCWQTRPINGQWFCTKPVCYKAGAAASTSVGGEELLRCNWEKVKEVHRGLRDQADTAGRFSAADDDTSAQQEEEEEAEAAASALAALAGSNGTDSSPCIDTAETPASGRSVWQGTSQLNAVTYQPLLQPRHRQQASSSSTTCSLDGDAAGCRDARIAAGAGRSQAADAAGAAAAALAQPAAAAELTAAGSGLGPAAVAAAAAAPGHAPGAGPIVGWAPPTKEYSNSNADMLRLWREHQLHLEVLALVLQEEPEALALLQCIVDLLFQRPCVRCFSDGDRKAKCGSGAWLCGTCNRMFGRLHTVTDEGALWALAKRVSVDPLYSLEAAQSQRQQPRRS